MFQSQGIRRCVEFEVGQPKSHGCCQRNNRKNGDNRMAQNAVLIKSKQCRHGYYCPEAMDKTVVTRCWSTGGAYYAMLAINIIAPNRGLLVSAEY